MQLSLQKKPWARLAPALAAAGASVLLYWRYLKMPRQVKYANGYPIVGLLLQILRGLSTQTLYDEYCRLHKAHGKTFAYHIFGIAFIETIDPRNLEHVLKKQFDNYVKGHLFRDPFTDILGDGIFNVDGHLWYHQRKSASKMFTKTQFETHIWQVVRRNTKKVSDVLHRQAGQEVCMFNLMNRFTLDTIGEIGFSRDIGSLEDPSSPFLASFDYAQAALIRRFWTGHGLPLWRVLRFFGLLWERAFPEHLKMLDGYCDVLVEDLMQKVDDGEDSSFVGLFMREPASQTMRKEDPKHFKKYMRDMVLNFLLAGRDTTAQCLTWTLFELTQHPDVLAKARDEIASVCCAEELTYQQLKDLKYLKAVLDEGLRLHPSVPTDGKLAVHSDRLPDGTWVPAGCFIQFTAYAQGRCEELWGSDASLFRPERWFEKPRPSSYEFVAFLGGPRECLGKRLAEMEMAMLLGSLIREFDIELVGDPEAVRYDVQLTLGCSPGLPMIIRPRK